MKHDRRPILAIAATTFVVTACPAPVQPADTIKIGFMGPVVADAALTETAANGARLAAMHVNAGGGVAGKQIEVVLKDDGADANKAAAVAEDLKGAGVVAVVGPLYSGIAKAVVEKVLKPAGIPSVSPSSTSPLLATFDDGGVFFRTITSDAFQGRAMSRQIQDDGLRKITILARKNAYGEAFADVLESDFNRARGAGAATKVVYEDTDSPQYDELKARFGADSEAIALIGYLNDGGSIFRDWIASGDRPGLKWYFSESFKDASFARNVNNNGKLEGLKGTYPISRSPFLGDYRRAYKAQFGKDPGYFSENAYDAVMLVALAMVKGGEASPAAIRSNIVSVASGGTKQSGFGQAGYEDAVARIKRGEDLDYDGASGPVDLDAAGELQRGSYVIWQWKDGQPQDTEKILDF